MLRFVSPSSLFRSQWDSVRSLKIITWQTGQSLWVTWMPKTHTHTPLHVLNVLYGGLCNVCSEHCLWTGKQVIALLVWGLCSKLWTLKYNLHQLLFLTCASAPGTVCAWLVWVAKLCHLHVSLYVVPQTQIVDDCIITKTVIKISLLPISFNNDVLLKVKQNS